ncbi:MAG TPA: DNA-binding response regulator [Chitinophagaceae bacterium]|nr:DNA-binding response regulator [Chitinophagaceae bacterium]
MKAIIIEDESLIARELQSKIATVTPDVNIMELLPSLKTAKKWLMQNAMPDLVFMDIQLSDGVSFELFETFDLTCPVIFTTAYDEYAVKAFKVNGIDYLLKPIDEDDLKKAIDKYRQLQEKNMPYPNDLAAFIARFGQQQTVYKEKFIVQQRNNWIPVSTSDIACFIRDNLNYLYTFSGEKYILDFNTLEDIEELIDPKLFYRTNRQSIIHVNAIQSVKPHENQKLTVTLRSPLKLELDVSREKAPAFKKWFDR